MQQISVAALDPQVAAPKNLHKHTWIALTLGVALIYLAFLPPGIYSVDGNAMLGVAESLVTRHSFAVAPEMGVAGRGGEFYSHWYPLLSVLAVPFVYVALLASRVSGLPFHYLAAVFSLPLIIVLTAVTSGLVALLALRIGANYRASIVAGLSYAFGTVALAYGRTFYAEPLLAFLAIAALYFSFGGKALDLVFASCCAGAAVLAKPTGVIVGAVLAAYLIWKGRGARALWPLAGTAAGTVLYLAYNVFRFGRPLDFGIGAAPFRLQYLVAGVPGLLFSPGYGLVWYCPVVIAAVAGFRRGMKTYRAEALAIAGMLTGFLLLHSCLPYWYAAWSWGPRYLVPAIPALCAFLGLVGAQLKKAIVLLALLGFLVNAPTLICFYERYYAELNEQGIATDETIAWNVRYAPVFHEWPAAIRQVREANGTDVKEIFQQRGAPSRTIEGSRALRIVAVWWWVLPVAGIPRLVGVSVSLVLVGLGGWVLWRQDKILKEAESQGLKV